MVNTGTKKNAEGLSQPLDPPRKMLFIFPLQPPPPGRHDIGEHFYYGRRKHASSFFLIFMNLLKI
jgi:hypothetical protein